MASLEDALERLHRTLVGYGQQELCQMLEDGGYEFVRPARHGKIYRHPRLAREHPDMAVRMRYAYVEIARGTELPAAAAKNVRDALQVLVSWEKGDAKTKRS